MALNVKSTLLLGKFLRNRYYRLPYKILSKGYASYQFKIQKPIYYPDRKDEDLRKQEQLKTDLVTEVKMDPELPIDYYYQLLGIPHNATTGQIKAAYYNLAKRFHPDSALGPSRMSKRFQEIITAYNVLSDDAKRSEYDRLGALKSLQQNQQTAKPATTTNTNNGGKLAKGLPPLAFMNDKNPIGMCV